MSITLPFEFDTSGLVVKVLRAVVAFQLFFAAAAAYALVSGRDPLVTVGLLASALIAFYVGPRFFRALSVSRGTITSTAVTVRPVHLYGIRLAGVEGTFPIELFRTVRVERVSASIEAGGGTYARVYLVGGDAAPDILIAQTGTLDEGRAFGRSLAATFALPVEERSAPY